jgi:hypothetical protein
MKKINRGKPLEELVKGSLEYTRDAIDNAFRLQFPYVDGAMTWYSIVDTFADYVVVSAYGELKPDEFFKVTYTRSGDEFTFAAKDQWEVVELAYQPQSVSSEQLPVVSEGKKRKGRKFEERIEGTVELTEAVEGAPRKLKVNDVIVAGVVNGNQRRYPSGVIEAAVAELRGRLNESAGSGRVVQVLGEAEHPSDKGGRSNLLETVVRWDEISFDGRTVGLGGFILGTSKGKDILALMEGGVKPGVSLRGYGDSKIVKESGQKIEEVAELHLTGFDLVMEPSFTNEAMLESQNHQSSMEDEMTLEELLKLLKDHPEAFEGITEAQIKKLGEAQLKALEENVRKALGIDANANISESLKAMADKSRKFDESQKRDEVINAITEATKNLPFGPKLNKLFTEALQGANLKSADDVKVFAEAKRKEYGEMAAAGVLQGMGFKGANLQVLGDVLENETGTPEFARPAFEITESIRKSEMRAEPTRKNESRAAVFTLQMLERFDKLYQRQLIAESKQFSEAESTADLSLPYSVSRAIIAEAFPNLVAANIFDVGLMNSSVERIYYEAFAGETGYTVTVPDEVVTGGAEDTWYDLDHNRVIPGTVVVTSNPAGTTYVEGTDFIIDYELGKIKFLTAGDIGANDVLVDYQYNAIRLGEDAEIERAKVTLSYATIEAAADRLADYITHEAIVFSRSQLGWDAVARTMANLVRQTRLNIDKNLIEKALSAALGVASNSGGTWTSATDPWSLLAEYIGYAKVKVANRYYEPTFVLMSETNADLLSNWDGFTRLGFPNALLDAAGFAGGVKGLPVFRSTQMRDTWVLVGNRELAMHRVFQPMTIKGPFQTFGANRKLVAAEQYYSEEYNASLAPIGGKGAVVKVA